MKIYHIESFLAVFIIWAGLIGRLSAHEPAAGRDCTGYAYAPAFATPLANYKPRFSTIAHRFLDAERDVGPVTAREYAILDSVLDEARSSLQPAPEGIDRVAYKRFAIDSLKKVDCILVRHGFVYPGIGLVNLLSDGLDSTLFVGSRHYNALLNSSHNAGRIDFIIKRKPGPYYVVDCDTASYIYLAVGELMNYPISMVQMPLHNFVRWRLPDESYIDFETMDGIETNDDYYVARWGIPRSFIGEPGVLTTMTASQLLAYENFGIGIAKTWKRDYKGAIAAYQKAIEIDATLSDSFNNLAWLYAVVPDLRYRDASQAVALAKKAVAILATGDALDTLACAYALGGDYQAAIDAESQAHWAPQGSDINGNLALFKDGRPCADPKFGIDPRPFREVSSSQDNIIQRDFNSTH